MSGKFNIGDMFEVVLGNGKVGYIQYISNDDTQLRSAVVRAFDGTCDPQCEPGLDQILSRTVKFYAHVFLKSGLTLNIWRKVGNAPPPETIDVVFRHSADYGDPRVSISYDWYIWRANEPFQKVGRLPEEFRAAEIGMVKAPQEIAARIRTGRYAGVYPGY